MENKDRRIIDVITSILWKYGCTFDSEKIDWVNRVFDDIWCPDDVYEQVAVEIEEALAELESEEEEIHDYIWRVPAKQSQ